MEDHHLGLQHNDIYQGLVPCDFHESICVKSISISFLIFCIFFPDYWECCHWHSYIFYISDKQENIIQKYVNPKKAGGSIWPFPPWGFSKNVFFINRVNPCFFVNFNIIISHLVTSFLKISLKFIKSFTRYEDFPLQYQLFSSIFQIFWHFVVAKKLKTSA